MYLSYSVLRGNLHIKSFTKRINDNKNNNTLDGK